MKLIIFLKSKDNLFVLSILVVFALSISLFIVDISPSDFTKGEMNSTLNYLSDVGVGALAAVLAIIISITTMAVQLSSQRYTLRRLIMETYTKSFIFRVVIIVYLFTILFNIFILNLIKFPLNSFDFKMVNISIISCMICFILLLPYFFFTLNQLRPEYVIERILKRVDKKFIKNHQEEHPPPTSEDPVSAVAGIIEKSIKDGDQSTIISGLDNLYECYAHLITEDKNNFIAKFFKQHFLNIARNAIQNSDSDTIERIVDIFVKMTHENPKETSCLSELGSILLGQQEIEVEEEIMKLLTVLGECQDAGEINMVGLKAAKNNQSGAAIEAVKKLVDLAKNENDLGKAEEIRNLSLGIILEATKHELYVTPASRSLGNYIGEVISKDKTLDELKEAKIWEIKLWKESNKVIAEMTSCWIHTISNLSYEKMHKICEKTFLNYKNSDEELPVCTVTFSCLATAIKKFTDGNVELKRSVERGEYGCKLTFEPK